MKIKKVKEGRKRNKMKWVVKTPAEPTRELIYTKRKKNKYMSPH